MGSVEQHSTRPEQNLPMPLLRLRLRAFEHPLSMVNSVDKKPGSPASYASFEEEEPRGGVLRTFVQFFAIPMLIVSIAVGLWMGVHWIAGSGPTDADDFVELLRSDTINRRWQAAYELANRLRDGVPEEFRQPRLLEALGSALTRARAEKEKPPRLAISVLRIIGRIADEKSIPVVRDALDDEDPWIRSYAVLGIGALGDRESRPKLVALASDTDPGTRRAALFTLARFDGGGLRPGGLARTDGAEAWLSRAVRQIAVDHLGDTDVDVRMTAALVLSETGQAEEAKPVLLKMLDRGYLESFEFNDSIGALDPNHVRSNTIIAGIKAVARLRYNDPPVLGALEKLTNDDTEIDGVVREHARKALQHLRDQNSLRKTGTRKMGLNKNTKTDRADRAGRKRTG